MVDYLHTLIAVLVLAMKMEYSFSWIRDSKKRCRNVVPLWVQRTRWRHNEGGKKREEGRMKKRE